MASRRKRRIVQRAARRHGIDPSILYGLWGAESNFGRNTGPSSAGAQGDFQFMPATARAYGIDPHNFRQAANAAAKYLATYEDRGVAGMLAAYNAGPAGNPNNPETQAYIPRVRQLARTWRPPGGGGGGAQPGAPTVTTRNRYQTIPAQSLEDERRAIKLAYLAERGKPGSLLELQRGLQGAQDIPARRVLAGTDRTIQRGKGGNVSSQDERQVKGPLREMFYNGPGGVNVDEGRRVGQGFVSGHQGHVHVAGQQRDMKKLGKLAQRMGLSVRENPAFDPVDPVHTKGSFHYGRREGGRTYRALDVSGDPAKMLAFNRRVARMYGV